MVQLSEHETGDPEVVASTPLETIFEEVYFILTEMYIVKN